MGFFKSKAERAQEKLDRDIERTEKRLKDDKTLSDIGKKRKELNKKVARREDSNFRDKVFETNVKLNQLEKKFVTKVVSEANAIKYDRSKNQSSARAERRMKNAYLSLVMVKHAKKRLVEIQNERDWNLAMRDLNGAIKTMNAISVGSENIQKLLFRTRVKQMGWKEDNESSGWFNQETEEMVSKENLDAVMNSDPVDLMVADDIYDTLLDDPTSSIINDIAERSVGVEASFDDMANMANKAEEEQTLTDDELIAQDFSDAELNESIRSWGKLG